MDITEHVDALRRDLAQAARAMGPELEQAAERLGYALDSSARLALMDALSHAAAEITNELDGTSVEVRLQGREPVFVVVGGGPAAVADDTQAVRTEDTTALSADDEGAETSRITLRLPEALKGRAEELAGQRGQSLNTWIVNAVRAATNPGFSVNVGPTGVQFGPGAPGRNRSSNKRVQGWVR
ncbi:toxin-antitoxin system HicB family antitoxin [Intrasporangium flavum]|uniref:toxin-antitoxin system HicB family antitoxin n=1 Tax=Intrasporangium flavum TaxID=1428657 RepID=UPI00096C5116|nr:toxin-antitoxin system HicB family antitoxin [Intrasporangium flavum]